MTGRACGRRAWIARSLLAAVAIGIGLAAHFLLGVHGLWLAVLGAATVGIGKGLL
jgi:hypothetical protein